MTDGTKAGLMVGATVFTMFVFFFGTLRVLLGKRQGNSLWRTRDPYRDAAETETEPKKTVKMSFLPEFETWKKFRDNLFENPWETLLYGVVASAAFLLVAWVGHFAVADVMKSFHVLKDLPTDKASPAECQDIIYKVAAYNQVTCVSGSTLVTDGDKIICRCPTKNKPDSVTPMPSQAPAHVAPP